MDHEALVPPNHPGPARKKLWLLYAESRPLPRGPMWVRGFVNKRRSGAIRSIVL